MSDGEEIKNAIVRSATMQMDRDVFLSGWVHLDYGGSGQGFGGYVLGGKPGIPAGKHRDQPNIAAEWLVKVMRACGVDELDKCQGKTVRAVVRDGRVVGIGHIVLDDHWFYPGETFKAWEAARQAPNTGASA